MREHIRVAASNRPKSQYWHLRVSFLALLYLIPLAYAYVPLLQWVSDSSGPSSYFQYHRRRRRHLKPLVFQDNLGRLVQEQETILEFNATSVTGMAVVQAQL